VIACPGLTKILLQIRKDIVLSSYQLDFNLTEAADNPPAIQDVDLIQNDIRNTTVRVRHTDTLPLRPKGGNLYQWFVSEMSHQEVL
jgi:hypothetical protein